MHNGINLNLDFLFFDFFAFQVIISLVFDQITQNRFVVVDAAGSVGIDEIQLELLTVRLVHDVALQNQHFVIVFLKNDSRVARVCSRLEGRQMGVQSVAQVAGAPDVVLVGGLAVECIDEVNLGDVKIFHIIQKGRFFL
jgi:hypothetical protein